MRGRFDIEEGDYLFTFQSFFKKPFKLKKGGSNFISWSGDPYNARIQFQATYTAENVSFAPLANTIFNADPSYARMREDVYVVANLSGALFKPDFKFDLEFEPNSRVNNDFAISSNIRQIVENENEINRQVTYLIVFNSFAPPETTQNVASGGIATTLTELSYSTISSLSGLFFNEINKKLNSELARILKTDNISINFSGAVYNRNLLDKQRQQWF
ncbi:MAG: translocation/assembly module TamB domain-containing protein [Chitinophagaceae bacterium]